MRHTTKKSEKVLLKGAKQKNKTGENKIMRESSWHLLRSIKGTESFSISFHFLLKNKRENTLSVIDCLLVLVVPMRKTSPMIPSLKTKQSCTRKCESGMPPASSMQRGAGIKFK